MNLANLNKIKKSTILILVVFLLFDCNYKKTPEWSEVKIDPEIRKDQIYIELDKQEEILSAFEELNSFTNEERDSFTKRTSDVAYYSDKQRKGDYWARFNNCRAFYFHSDTLSIDIGVSSGFVASGFSIRYKNNKFYIQPYYWSDGVGHLISTYKIIYQKLTLDKPNYNVGDSLYGRIEFKINETHFGIGNFRAKVEKR